MLKPDARGMFQRFFRAITTRFGKTVRQLRGRLPFFAGFKQIKCGETGTIEPEIVRRCEDDCFAREVGFHHIIARFKSLASFCDALEAL